MCYFQECRNFFLVFHGFSIANEKLFKKQEKKLESHLVKSKKYFAL